MADKFDPYHEWLGIPASEQPPNHYRLLAIPAFEESPTVIENAADRQMAHLRQPFQAGKHSQESQRLLNEVAAARICLLTAAKKAAYDQQLKKSLQKPQAPTAPPPLPGRHAGAPAGGAMQETAAFDPKLHSAGPGEPTSTATVDLPKLGEYQLLEQLGSGGMGTVYKALHTKLDRHVAIKVLPKGPLEDAQAIARFEREMKAIGRWSIPMLSVPTTPARSPGPASSSWNCSTAWTWTKWSGAAARCGWPTPAKSSVRRRSASSAPTSTTSSTATSSRRT